MKRIGKIFLGVLCAAALAAGGFWINDRLSYPIDPGMDGLEGSLTNWLNRGIDAVHGYQPRLHEPVTLGERTYVPMEVGEKLGYALLERSITRQISDRPHLFRKRPLSVRCDRGERRKAAAFSGTEHLRRDRQGPNHTGQGL